jgi:hypothetical protein
MATCRKGSPRSSEKCATISASLYIFVGKRKNLSKWIKVYIIFQSDDINPLNTEINPIYHFLVLLGDLTFMGPCIESIFQYISNKMQRYTVYLYLEIALHVDVPPETCRTVSRYK